MIHLHATFLYAGVLGLLLLVMSFNMTKNWVRVSGLGLRDDIDLRRAEALVSSFTDYVPLTLLLMALAEIGGAPALFLHITGLGLIAARLMHAFGSNHSSGADALRFLGVQLTYLVIAALSFCSLYAFALPPVGR